MAAGAGAGAAAPAAAAAMPHMTHTMRERVKAHRMLKVSRGWLLNVGVFNQGKGKGVGRLVDWLGAGGSG